MKPHKPTLDDMLDEIEQTRLQAIEANQLNTALSATLAKVKLLGLDKAGANGLNDLPTEIHITFDDGSQTS